MTDADRHVERVLRHNWLVAARKYAEAKDSGSEDIFILSARLRRAIMGWCRAEKAAGIETATSMAHNA